MRAIMLFVTAAACAAGTARAQEKTVYQIPGTYEGLPFSSAVQVGDLLFLSGQIGVMPGTLELASGGIVAETRQTMENIREVLEYAGRSFRDVVKCTVFLLNIEDYGAMNRVYVSFFPEGLPARSALATTGLALGALVEIECIALAGADR